MAFLTRSADGAAVPKPLQTLSCSWSRWILQVSLGAFGLLFCLASLHPTMAQLLPYDGELAFQSGHFTSDIWLMDVGRGLIHRLYTDDSAADRRVSWSPDGSKLAFLSDHTGDTAIYLASAASGAVRQLTDRSISDRFRPTWSADSERIAFVSNETGNNDIYVATAENGQIANVTKHPSVDRRPVWSPDGEQIAFLSNRDKRHMRLYLMDKDGSNVRKLSDYPVQELSTFAWSPEGQKIVFASYQDGLGDLYVLTVSTSEVQRLTDTGGLDFHPAWSSDGRYIAYWSEYGGGTRLVVIEANGNNPRPLTETINCTGMLVPNWFSWSPATQKLAVGIYGDPRPDVAGIHLFDVDHGTRQHLLTTAFRGSFPTWRP